MEGLCPLQFPASRLRSYANPDGLSPCRPYRSPPPLRPAPPPPAPCNLLPLLPLLVLLPLHPGRAGQAACGAQGHGAGAGGAAGAAGRPAGGAAGARERHLQTPHSRGGAPHRQGARHDTPSKPPPASLASLPLVFLPLPRPVPYVLVPHILAPPTAPPSPRGSTRPSKPCHPQLATCLPPLAPSSKQTEFTLQHELSRRLDESKERESKLAGTLESQALAATTAQTRSAKLESDFVRTEAELRDLADK